MLVRVCVFVDSSLGRGYVCSVLWLIWVPQAEMDERKCSFPDCAYAVTFESTGEGDWKKCAMLC